MDQKIEELFQEYDRKMNELCNDSPAYDTDDLFNTYRAYRKVILAKRAGLSEEALEKDIRAFAAMTDALHVRKDAPERIYLWPEGKMPAEPESRIPRASRARFGMMGERRRSGSPPTRRRRRCSR